MSKGVNKPKDALANMIANTTDELQTAIKQLNNLHDQTDAYMDDCDIAWSNYHEAMEATKQHLEEKTEAEKRVERLSDNLKVLADGFIGKLGKR